jgi:uncharacterized RDD family membrane protein YckC
MNPMNEGTVTERAWYYAQGEQRMGPVAESVLRDQIARGTVRRDTLVWTEGMAQWLASGQVAIFESAFGTPAAPVSPQGQTFSPAPQAFSPPVQAGTISRPRPEFGEGELPYSSVMRRFAAMILDGMICGLLIGLVMAVMVMVVMGTAVVLPISAIGGICGFYVLPFMTFMLYHVLQDSSKAQATLGKRALGIRVQTIDGRPLTFGRALGRFLAKTFIRSALIFGIGYLVAFFTTRRQSVHDLLAETVVVKVG